MRVNPSICLPARGFLSFLLILVAVPAVRAQSVANVNYQEHIHLTSFLHEDELLGYPYDLLACDRYLIAANWNALEVIDVADRHRPLPFGSVTVPTKARELATYKDGSHVVVVGGGGLAIIDMGDPAHPLITDTHEYSYGYVHLAVAGNLALASKDFSGATLFDITSPDNIRYLANIEIPYTSSMTGRGDFVYLCWDGITVVDLTDPENPTLAGTVGQGTNYRKMACQEDLAYVTGSFGLQVFDMSDPVTPVLIGVGDERYYGEDVSVVGDRAYVLGDDGNHNGFVIYDVSDPTRPTLQVEVETEINFSIEGTECFVYAGGFDGLRIFNAVNTTLAGPYDPPSFPTSSSDLYALDDMAQDGDRTYIRYSSYLYVYDWGTGNNPQYLERIYLADSYLYGLAVTGDIVLLGDGIYGVRIIDISDLANPQECGTVDTPGFARDIFVFGTTALVVDGGTLQILDFADPYQATLVGELDTPGYGRGAILEGNTLFLAAETSGVQVIDVTDPLAPVLIGSAAADGAYRLDWEDGLLAVALASPYNYHPEVRFFDVADPAHPQFLGATPLPDADDVALHDGFAYVAAFEDGLIVLDARDPANPYPMGTIFEYYRPTALYRMDDYVMCGDYIGRVPFQQTNVSGVASPPRPGDKGLRLSVQPNPFNPKTTVSFRVEQPGEVNLCVYDLAGRKVATLVDRAYPAGEHRVDWTGRNDRGRAVPSGVYFVQVQTEDARDTRKISLVR